VFTEAEYQRVFKSMQQDRADALMVSDESEHSAYRAVIIDLAAQGRIPTIYPFRDFVDSGGLMAYSIDQAEVYRRLANLIEKILAGASLETFPSTNIPNSHWSSISRPRKRSASKCRRCCSAAPMT
jgi:putative tryptophan/tyrosine transport system substrate-binding protein